MISEPWFWREDTIAAQIVSIALLPVAAAYQIAARARRKLSTAQNIPSAVICVGNITSGGVGKTPFAIALLQILEQRGVKCFFSTRGYGGSANGPLEVDPNAHSAELVGDEALLLAAVSRTWVAKKRAAGASAAAMAGAEAVIMDDGFQNPTVKKDVSFLLVDGNSPFANGKTLPAGPLREPVRDAVHRADAIIVVVKHPDDQISRDLGEVFKSTDVFRCWVEPQQDNKPQRVVAFAGIARPERFFETASSLGFDIAGQFSFPDHHSFTLTELNQLKATATKLNAALLTTEKDFVRIPAKQRKDIATLPIRIKIEDPDRLGALVDAKLKFHNLRADQAK